MKRSILSILSLASIVSFVRAEPFDAPEREKEQIAMQVKQYLAKLNELAKTAPIVTAKAVETDQAAFIDKPFGLSGEIDVSGSYYGHYRHAQEEFLAFTLRDDSGAVAHLYADRPIGAPIRERILAAGKPIQIEVAAVIFRDFWEKSAPCTAHILKFRDPESLAKEHAGLLAAMRPRNTTEAQQMAVRLHPDLAKPGTPLNQRFVARVTELRASDPQYFAAVDWPLKLAEELAAQ